MILREVVSFLASKDELLAAKTLLNTFAKYANTLQQYDELGMLYEKVKAYPESLAMLHKCLELSVGEDQRFAIYSNFSKVYNHVNDPDSAIHYALLILEKFPDEHETRLQLAFSHYLKNELDKSYEIQKALFLNHSVSDELRKRIQFNMGSFELMRGNFKAGIRNTVIGGRALNIYPQKNTHMPRWNGNKDTKSQVIVFAESGIGDEIINIRFMKEFQKRNIEAVWVDIRPDMCSIFQRNGYNAIDNISQLDTSNSLMCEAMSLPVLLDLDKTDLWHEPYLKPSQEHIDKWKKILPDKFMTIRWAGNPYYDQDLHRTVDRKSLIDALSQYNISLVSLQIDSKGADSRLLDIDIETWEDTLAVQYLAYMNITSCTSTAHSASAMGAPCIVLPPIATYYTWMDLRDDDTTYWYGPNTKVFPQTKHKDWSHPIAQACKHIERKLENEKSSNST